MNITDANRFICALNHLAEGATMLASAIEEAAWESIEDRAGMLGVRPIAAAQLAQPALEAAAEQYETTHQPANPQPAPAKEPERVPFEQVRSLIQATGVDKLSEVDPAKYGWLLTQAEAIRDA